MIVELTLKRSVSSYLTAQKNTFPFVEIFLQFHHPFLLRFRNLHFLEFTSTIYSSEHRLLDLTLSKSLVNPFGQQNQFQIGSSLEMISKRIMASI